MKQSQLVGFSLTLLMLLLVLAAAFVFTFQGQQELQTRVEQRDAMLATRELSGTLTAVSATAVDSTREALSSLLATTEAERDKLNNDVTSYLVEIESLSTRAAADLATAQGELSNLRQELASQGPTLALEVLQRPAVVGEALRFFVAASDLQGITRLDITYDDRTTSYAGENQPLFTRMVSQTMAVAGPYTVTVTAHNINQNTAMELITGTVQTAVSFRQEEIASTVQTFASQPGLESVQPPILIRRPAFNQWLAAQFGNLSAETVSQQARVLQAFDLITAEEAAALPGSVTAWQQTDFALLFYAPPTERFVLVDEDALEGSLADWLLVMEATTPTALLPDGRGFDAQLGFQAQVLGEAALLQGLYLASSGATAVSPNQAADSLPGLPPTLRDQLLFPYTQGYLWARALYEENGLPAVTAARQTAASTHQVLAGNTNTPQEVELPEVQPILGNVWQRQGSGVWGALRLQQMLAAQVEAGVDTAVAGWAGDQYAVYWREADNALLMVLRVVWDSAASAVAFGETLDLYAATLFGQPQPTTSGACWSGSNEVFCHFESATETLIVRAPTIPLAEEISKQ